MQYAAFIWVLVILVPFFVLFVRPQRRQMRAVASMQSRLVIGEDVVTTSGIYGKIVELGDKTAELEIAPGTRIKIVRRAIGRRLAEFEAATPPEDPPS